MSGKISAAFFAFLREEKIDLEGVFEVTELAPETLRDPTSWMEAQPLELCLKQLALRYDSRESLPMLAGHAAPDLRAWGVLDSVLRLMQNPNQIFLHPDKFLSYFISPPPPVLVQARAETFTEMHLPIAAEEFPMTTQFLRAVLEALPKFMGQPMAQVTWKGTALTIDWSHKQESLLEKKGDLVLNPQLVDDVLVDLEKAQRELEETRRLLKLKEEEMAHFKSTRASQEGATPQEKGATLFDFLYLSYEHQHQNLMRLMDYLLRAQQVVGLFLATDKNSKTMKELLHRTDWNKITLNLPDLLENYRVEYQSVTAQVGGWRQMQAKSDGSELCEVGPLVRKIVSEVEQEWPSSNRLESHIFYEGNLRVFKREFSASLKSLLMDLGRQEGRRLLFNIRPKGPLLEIELGDVDAEEVPSSSLQLATQLASQHGGRARHETYSPGASLFMQWPMRY